jgi:hypothetical protein
VVNVKPGAILTRASMERELKHLWRRARSRIKPDIGHDPGTGRS